ncbi:metallophosphoesterase [Rhodosalinus sp. K401]|uniref:metallophosphoesterase family protein n=1 Tax=Rhodosalinus sp. K401 TaxID=3239195 RepID=UPI00352316FC
MRTPLFTVALIADTHINPVDGQSGSPWRSNALANDRARWAVAALNADRPEMVFHLGDMVHPLPAQESYANAAARFRAIFAGLHAPLHCLPGNHDIGDKPGDWMPAHPVTAESFAICHETFGTPWRVVDHGSCRFILHCSPILGSGLPEDEAQWSWLKARLKEAGDRRVFFLTHYPLFLTHADEPEHYDNLAWPVRDRLRRLLVAHGVEAVFAAHVHTIFHTPLSDAPGAPLQNVVPSVSALRLDYSYMFRAPPGPGQEHGRNDAQKLGYYLLDVMPEGYRIRLRRSGGCAVAEEDAAFNPGPHSAYDDELSERELGVDMRHGWAQPIAIPYSGVVDEFRRKYVRNDYLVTALQEAGIRDLRVPIDDLQDSTTRARMHDLARMGHRFQAFTIDGPHRGIAQLLGDVAGLSGLEVIARQDEMERMLCDWRAAKPEGCIELLASRLWSSADIATEATKFSHGIGHGFFPTDTDLLAGAAKHADGVVIRVGPDMAPQQALAALPATDLRRIVLYVTMTSSNPAQPANNDAYQCARILSALRAAQDYPVAVSVMLDTFDDHDRGYFPRHGLYDVQFNPRPAAIYLSSHRISGSRAVLD